MRKRKDEYDDIYNNFDEESEEILEEPEYDNMYDEINNIRGTIQRGTCMFCGEENAMKYEGNVCFICSKCNEAVTEDIYYQWLLGYDMEFED